jgi:bifunctional enzyme CysN/CysC
MKGTILKERMNIVIAGHVDHGKSTLIGRLLVDTNSLPEGKVEQIKKVCERNSKPFEYAFLLDSLEDEQSQGITIDSARIFFKTGKREYIIIDAPGHIEFLKNMVSGAARAEAAILLIDANEGIAENSKRHAYMLSLLGIKNIVVAVNKMDLVSYSQEVFEFIAREYSRFLKQLDIEPFAFIPVSARDGDNVVKLSPNTSWYSGRSIIEIMDEFKKEKDETEKPFRLFVQGIYKFDSRRIIAGTINSGKINTGDEVVFLPSGKRSFIKSIESFNRSGKKQGIQGEALGFTLDEEIYIKPSELMCRKDEQLPKTSNRFKVNIFWLGKQPLVQEKEYKLKIGTLRTPVEIEKIEHVLDAAEINKYATKESVRKNEVARCILKTKYEISFDLINEILDTSRFVIVDGYDIAGGGIIIKALEKIDKTRKPYHEFEIELNKLIRKHFPHWDLKSLVEKE